MSLVAGFVIAALAWLIGRRQAAVVALIAIAGYTALTGASPSVVRAAIMGGLFVCATLAGRPSSATTSIALAAAAMTAWHPGVVHDVSFQLSFASVLGLMYLSPGFEERGVAALRRLGIEPEGLFAFVNESFAVTLGAVGATLPLIALHFGRVSLVAPFANVVAVPAFPVILASSALTAFLGLVWAPLGEAAGWAAWLSLSWLVETARFFAEVPLASFEIEGFGMGHAAVAYAGIGWLAWRFARRLPPAQLPIERLEYPLGVFHLRPSHFAIGGLAVACVLVWFAALSPSGDGRLSVTVLDVGQGDAVLIETPEGHRVLVDGGPDGTRLAEELSDALPFWDRRIDLVVVSHPQRDHLAGLIEALERYDVRAVMSAPGSDDTELYAAWQERLRAHDVPQHTARAGDSIDLGEGVTLDVLGPTAAALASDEVNDHSLVLRLSYGATSFLLTGDIEAYAETALVAADPSALESTVLKVAHHGSRTSSTPLFLQAVRPELAVVSAGAGNSFGHPAEPVLDRLRDVPVARTDLHGTVRMETDGERLWVRTER